MADDEAVASGAGAYDERPTLRRRCRTAGAVRSQVRRCSRMLGERKILA